MSKKITITIKDGAITTDFQNFQGKDCDRMATKLHPIDHETLSRKNKPEYDQSNLQTDTQLNEA